MKIITQYRGLTKSAYILFIARLVTTMGAFIWPMLTLIMSTKMNYSPSEISLIFVIVAAVFMPATILGGKLADVFDRKKIIIAFDLVTVVFFVLAGLMEPGLLMLIFFCIAGLFATMEGPAYEALVADISLPKDREKIYSLTYLGHNVGFIAGASIGGLLIANHLDIAFFIDAATTLMSTILIILFIKVVKLDNISDEERNEYEDDAQEGETGYRVLQSRKPIFMMIGIIVLVAFIYDQWTFLLPLHMGELYGDTLGPRYYGFISSFNGLIVIIFTPLLTLWLRKTFEIPKLMTGMFLYTIGFLILYFTDQLYLFFLFMFVFTIGEVINSLGSTPYVSRRVPNTHRGRISSYIGIGYFVGATLGRAVMGPIIENFGFDVSYLFVTGVTLLAFFLYQINYKMDKKMFPKLYEKKTISE